LCILPPLQFSRINPRLQPRNTYMNQIMLRFGPVVEIPLTDEEKKCY
jgi:hypothetical protein